MRYKNSNVTNELVELWDVLDKEGNKTGRKQESGWLKDGNYHLIVHIWIINSKKEFLISKRTSNKRWPNMWGCTIGSAVAGDNSLTTAIKEVKEELGIVLSPESGQLFKQYKRDINDNCGEFIAAWLFNHEADTSEIVFQPDETCVAMWASKSQIKQMMDEGIFLSSNEEACPYINELFYFCDKNNENGIKI
jgi:isopentenyldiphosphate isomerase